MNHKYLPLFMRTKRQFLKLVLLLCVISLIMITGCVGQKAQISYEFEAYLSGDTAFEQKIVKFLPAKEDLTDAKVTYYMFYDDGMEDNFSFQYNMLCLSVEYTDTNYTKATQKMKELSEEYYNDIFGSHFYYNGILYEGFQIYDEEYYALAYHICSDSNTVSYIAFSSGDLAYMNVKSALECFPYFETENQVVPYE